MFCTVHGNIQPGKLFNCSLYNPKSKSLDVQRWLREEEYEDKHGHKHQQIPKSLIVQVHQTQVMHLHSLTVIR